MFAKIASRFSISRIKVTTNHSSIGFALAVEHSTLENMNTTVSNGLDRRERLKEDVDWRVPAFGESLCILNVSIFFKHFNKKSVLSSSSGDSLFGSLSSSSLSSLLTATESGTGSFSSLSSTAGHRVDC